MNNHPLPHFLVVIGGLILHVLEFLNCMLCVVEGMLALQLFKASPSTYVLMSDFVLEQHLRSEIMLSPLKLGQT